MNARQRRCWKHERGLDKLKPGMRARVRLAGRIYTLPVEKVEAGFVCFLMREPSAFEWVNLRHVVEVLPNIDKPTEHQEAGSW